MVDGQAGAVADCFMQEAGNSRLPGRAGAMHLRFGGLPAHDGSGRRAGSVRGVSGGLGLGVGEYPGNTAVSSDGPTGILLGGA